MTLRITKVWVCDICKAEWGDFAQEVTSACIEAVSPREDRNQLTYHGQTYDLCMLCMAPVHEAFIKQVQRIADETRAQPVKIKLQPGVFVPVPLDQLPGYEPTPALVRRLVDSMTLGCKK